MKLRSIESSPQLYARTGGAFYLILIVVGFFGEAVRDRLIAADAATTAANITSQVSLWRIGIAAEFVALIFVTALAMIYFLLLRPVHKELNLLATFLRLVAIAIEAVATLNLFAAMFPLGTAPALKAFTQEQLYVLTNLAIKSHSYGFAVALFFFGFCFLVHGYLIFRSSYLPKLLGILIQIAGACYLTNSLALFLAPSFQNRIFPIILIPAFLGETSLCLWLLFKGVNVPRWEEKIAERPRSG